MSIKKIFLLFTYILSVNQLFAQSGYAASAMANATNSLGSASSGNSFLNCFGPSKSSEEIGVDLYTGTATVNIPICNLEAKDMSIPISLNYVGGRGIKVQDIANDVGLGWQLNAGGYIKRLVRGGLPDEASWTVEGYLRGVGAPAAGNSSIDAGFSDGASDVYYVRTPFASFHFSFDVNNQPLLPDANNGYKIIYNLPVDHATPQYPNPYNSTPLSFEIIDDKGNRYFFNTQDVVIMPIVWGGVVHGDTWYLDKIITYNSKETINFNYTAGSNYTQNNWVGQTKFPYSSSVSYNGSPFPPGSAAAAQASLITIPTTYYSVQYLSSITTSLGEVDFTYAKDRQDFPTVQRLASVTLKAYDPVAKAITVPTPTTMPTKLLRTYGFNYSYFGAPSTDVNQLRLRLDNITVTGNDANTSTPLTLNSFLYNATNLPPRNSPQFDYWGYYNADPSKTANTWYCLPEGSIGAPNRAANYTSTMANILTTVYSITGNMHTITYEQNIWHPINGGVSAPNTIAVGGLRVASISNTILPSGQTLTTQYVYNDANGNSTGQVYGYGTPLTSNPLQAGTIGGYYTGIGVFYDALSYYNLVNRTTDVNYPQPATWQISTLSQTPYDTYDLNGVFIGYSSVKVIDPNGGYTVNKFTNFSDFSDITSFSLAPANFLGRYIYNNNLGGFLALPNPTSPSPYQAEVLPATPNCSIADYSYRRGLLLSGTAYTAAGNKVSETDNTYTLLNVQPQTEGGYTPINWGLADVSYYVNDNPMNSGPDPNYNSASCATTPGNFRLTKTVQKDYDQQNPVNYVQKEMDFTYSPSNYRSVQTATTIDSKGTSNTETVFHADDYYPVDNTGGVAPLTSAEQTAVTTMINNNNTSVLVHAISKKNGVVLHQLHNTYMSGPSFIAVGLANGSLVGYSDVKNYIASSAVFTGSTLQKQQSFNYDGGTSNLISATDLGGEYVSTEYGYNSCYPIAKVINANSNEYYFDGFEENPLAVPVIFGNLPTSTQSHTGNMFLNYAHYTVPFVMPNNRNYIIQWWSLGNDNKWVFNQKPYTNNMVLNNGAFDDIRVFPADAQMTTYTYDPLVGKTSETDPSGRTTTYEYDGLGRINIIRDQDRNIIKKYCYNYAGQATTNCSQ